ncbi:hypothetical protein RI129_007045 [Pyrocoelia pectoralis]|uniref:Protein SPT2 homolog n=1 Tax=Pyrocoelia pectoralis TaxID=417401 RepID=A0AAN7V7B2_9COLE
MDFGSLLQTAKENDQSKREVRYYSTKFAPPKKEEKKAKNLSVNIQKFLARKEAEEKKKQADAVRKRDELLALRSKDKKATRRVNVMLKRTKSANQSVIEDAVDRDNTAVTLAGPSQPDEDDYGYVSQEAAAYYNKMMEKYNKMPDDPKFPSSRRKASNNLSNTKDRVRAALEREKEEALLPHRRKRKHKEEDETVESEICEKVDENKNESPIKKNHKVSGPPAMNFNDLLKLAAVKQHQPIMIEVKPKEEEGPLLTKKQKKEQELEQQRKEAKNQKILQQSNNKLPLNPPGDNKKKMPSRTPILQQANGKIPTKTPQVPQPPPKQNKVPPVNHLPTKAKMAIPTKSPLPTPKLPSKPMPNNKNNIPKKTSEINGKYVPKPPPSKSPPGKPVKNGDPSRMENYDREKMSNIKSKPPANVQFKKPPHPQQSKPKQFPPPDVRRREPPPKQKTLMKRRIIDDEEYDSEMDDFIDDGPEDSQDYSTYIKDIFGYDRNKYRDVDDDVDNMESTFAQQMREDVRSTKLGIMEDLEDIRREREEKKRKQMLKKRKL